MTRVLCCAAAAAVLLSACGPRDEAPPASGPDASTPTGPAASPESREFREWRAVCDNGQRCAAYTGSDEGGWLLIRMDPGPDARPEIVAGQSAFEDPASALTLSVDGRDERLARGPEERTWAVSGDAPALVTALASARSIRIGAVDVPAAGAAAALLWIDERQGRLDTPAALMRKGEQAASAIPAGPALPQATAASAIDQGGLNSGDPLQEDAAPEVALPAAIEALPTVKTCRVDTEFNAYLQKAVLAARLGPEAELWGVPCGSGSYNASYAIYVSGPGGRDPRPAVLPSSGPDQAEEGDDQLTNPSYDPATRVLTHFPRGRGIGDCGLIQSWVWTGRAFALAEERMMGDCWGMPSTVWPTTWRSRP